MRPFLLKTRRIFLLISCLFIIFLTCAGLSHGAESDSDAVKVLVEAVTRKASTAYDLTCDVVQEKHLSMLARPVVFTGKLSVQRPSRLRWEFTSPIPSVFIINGSKVMRCTPGMAPVEFDANSNPVMKQAAAQMLAWVSGDFMGLSQMFRLSLAPQGTGLVLVPRVLRLSGGISRITVMFDPATLRPSSVRIDEQGGDWTLISMSNYRINTGLPASLFTSCER